ncbi:hypothetical protein MADE_1014595 [Alteromonas mediterranea DE]|uniref:Uncharacterized protein n=2 Tax=Alteromonas mediterranea TaxID=314275 RepID=F2GC97_ALTMD|nr:hypothetical protein MADE_1014595 [Alteromonas mediterranea DE]
MLLSYHYEIFTMTQKIELTTFKNPTDFEIRVSAPPYAVVFEAGEEKAVKPALVDACLAARLTEVKPASKTTSTAAKTK